ncbi:MAG: N-6 DNA methylase [Rhodocyclaceae bacterium]|nr:N-6 DNA methylase [Rhodocyclaceae bacterium]
MDRIDHYKLPSTGEHREKLRQKGQFWTPDWVAEAMCAYALRDGSPILFDPAVGAGAFFRAGKKVAQERHQEIALTGMEIDPKVLHEAIRHGLVANDLAGVTLGDFVFQPPERLMTAIVANPPYLRHHRISAADKEKLKLLAQGTLGKALDGRAGLHIFFLIRALSLLEEDGRLAFIMPADTCEGKSAPELWRWIGGNFCLDAVIAFAPDASPFPGVDTNPLIFFIRKSAPKERFHWALCREPRTDALLDWVRSGFDSQENELGVVERELIEGLQTGLSRPPVVCDGSKYVLGDFVRVVRGIATGANDFFFLTADRAAELGIPKKYLLRAVGRTRDIPGTEVSEDTLRTLEREGRPTWLLALDGEPASRFPEAVRHYLIEGEIQGLPNRSLISQRKPWYKMEKREAPPFLFSYLGRRNSRFIRNRAGVLPLTGFLCVYPLNSDPNFVETVWTILNDPDTVANLARIGKSYGGGAVKVEPRSLEKLPIPAHVLEKVGMSAQLRLFQPEKSYAPDHTS